MKRQEAEGSAVPQRVWGATLLLALGRQWSALCTLATVAILSRRLDAEDFGRFTFWLAIFSLADFLVDCGTSTVAIQRGAQDPTEFAAAIAAGRRIRLGAAAIAAALVAAGVWGLHERQAGWVALAALWPFTRVLELTSVVFQREIAWTLPVAAWTLPVALRSLGATARLGLIAALAALGARGFGPFLVAHAGGLALGNVAIHFVARARLPERAGRTASGLLRAALPLAALGLCQQAYLCADNLFVRVLRGEAELGRYNAAVRIFSWLVFFAAFATTTALPWLARRFHEGQLGNATAALARPLFVASCALTGAFWPWCGPVLRTVYGPGFEAGAPSLRWCLAASVAVYGGAAFLTAVIAAGRSRSALGIAALALSINLAANACLVPRIGIEGAAAAKLLTEGTVLAASLAVLARIGAAPRTRSAAWLLGPAAFAVTFALSRAVAPLLPQ